MDSSRLFASILDTEQDTPDVIWNMDMRERLLDHLTSELEPYVKSRASDPMAPYVHTPRDPLHYPELTGKFRVQCMAAGCNIVPMISIHSFSFISRSTVSGTWKKNISEVNPR